MAITHKAARAAAQLHEAAQEIARLAARRSAQAQGQLPAPPVPARPVLARDRVEEACLPAAPYGSREIASARLPVAPAATSEKAAGIGVAGIAVPAVEAYDMERAAGRP